MDNDQDIRELFKEAAAVTLTKEERLRLRESLHVSLSRRRAPWQYAAALVWQWLGQKPLPAAGIALLLILSGASYAAETALPDETLYPLKISVNEKIRSVFNFSPQARAAWEVWRLERRLEEAEALAAEGRLNPGSRDALAQNISAGTSQIYGTTSRPPEEREEIIRNLKSVLDAHEKTLALLAKELEAEAAAGEAGRNPAPTLSADIKEQNGSLTFADSFDGPAALEETGSMGESPHPDWWVNSGGIFRIENGVGKTLQGKLSALSKWQILYAASNPTDTDGGYRPQNIFRLFTRGKWQNAAQQVYFKINDLNLDESPNRNASNGVHLFHRYRDEDNIYFTSMRVDGNATIKKKAGGLYNTLEQKPIFKSEKPYHRQNNPSLLPLNTWIGLRAETTDNPDGSVAIRMFIDRGGSGEWELAAETVDKGKIGGAPFREPGFAGIRADFMDAEFDNYRITGL